jgi:type 1 fimbria pilin
MAFLSGDYAPIQRASGPIENAGDSRHCETRRLLPIPRWDASTLGRINAPATPSSIAKRFVARDWLRCFQIMFGCALGTCVTSSANADPCTFATGSFKSGTLDLGNITVPANAPTGSTIKTITTSYNSIIARQATWCGTDAINIASFSMNGSGTNGIYPTNIAGIGIRMFFWSNTAGYNNTPTTATPLPYSWSYSLGGYVSYDTTSLQIQIDLVVTGPVGGKGLSTLSYTVSPWYQVKNTINTLAIANLVVTAQLTTNTCDVNRATIPVTLPTAFMSNFNTGSTGATPFNVSLNCVKGTNVKLTLTDASNPSNTSTTLSLSPDSTATGVALQILSGSTPVGYGPDSAAAGNTNQWSAGIAEGGPLNIPLTVQYVRTAGPLTPGKVKGLATFTMSYQ